MALKNLTHFTAFNATLFLSGKELRFVSASPWVEKSDSGAEVMKGVKVTLLIFKDDSDYPNEKNNLGEQLVVKVPFASLDDFSSLQPMLSTCEISEIEKAVVYGDFRNQLSLTGTVVPTDEVLDL
ncbi:hypothetical protein ACTGW6_06875 [Streptococcus suis]|uniref:Uncharacterized protein n=1 Tax=Streptococcus suis TaxID=1307 RepID=A0A123U1S3_STRSU|nr:hypothetical protein [Streptococcus suis]NQG65409.1 hypothetical protein [Streptococcus suis]NQG67404.1 hypothetical protein [Streptococcus suis]CYV66885.1 Uncharacterised protein [Streptococcus suis]CYV90291.1 Uncharacterised protein [Streptococcus suis]HEM6154904.1 hypothetical protein [Streptococcus suis]